MQMKKRHKKPRSYPNSNNTVITTDGIIENNKTFSDVSNISIT